jgi:single-stranded-DNA-specific exonuclease
MGSGRSIEEFNLIKNIQKCSDLLLRYGGHAQACGFTLEINNLEKFKKKFTQIVIEELKDKDLRKTLDIEAEIKIEDVNWDLMNALEQFKPFGEENPKPRFLLSRVKILDWQLVGADGNHLRLFLTHDNIKSMKAIGFGLGHWSEKLEIGKCIDMVSELDINEWNGNRELQIKIIDLRLCKN